MERLILRLVVPALLVCVSCAQPDARTERATAAAAPAAPASTSSTPVDAVTASNAPRIVFLGDSLTAGYGLAKEESVPSLLQKRLRENGYPYEVVNAGVSGDTSAGGL